MATRSPLLLGVCALAACSDVQLHPERADDGAVGRLLADPGALDFGLADLGTTASALVTLGSVGDAPVAVESIEVFGASFTLLGPSEGVLSPGEAVALEVRWTATGLGDMGWIQVESDAETPTLEIPLTGAARLPAIAVEPGAIHFEGIAGVATEEVLVRSVGTAPLTLSTWALTGPFTLEAPAGPLALAPGATTTATVRWDLADGAGAGELWIDSDALDAPALVPVDAVLAVPCVGLGEALDRGFASVSTDGGHVLTIWNDDPYTPICIDDWYAFVSPDTQDYAAGDAAWMGGLPFPLGTLRVEPQQSLAFHFYGEGAAAWCVEEPQYSQPWVPFDFTAGRLPAPVRDILTSSDGTRQTELWGYQSRHPLVLAGRGTHWIGAPGGGTEAPVTVRLFNLGDWSSPYTLRETLPPGWTATDVDPAPSRVEVDGDGGQVLVWEGTIDRRAMNGAVEELHFDYTLSIPPCTGDVVFAEGSAEWEGESGPVTSTGAPMVVACDG